MNLMNTPLGPIPPSGEQNEAFWNSLIALINAGRVIPIVGPDLLVLDGQSEPFSVELARKVADQLGVALPKEASGPGPSLTQVAVAYPGELQEVYTAVYDVLQSMQGLPIPDPLLKLARILPLQLFVSTTIDDFLRRAIDQERFGGRAETQLISFAPQRANDLEQTLAELERPAVFHLMGRATGVPFEYAVTEEDVLEFVRSLESDERPRTLLGELDDNHVLIIGSGYSGWLARFFVRLAQQDRLVSLDQETTVIADRSVCSDPKLSDSPLREFLSQFSRRSRLFYADPVAFVDELYQRWEQAPKPPPRPRSTKPRPPLTTSLPPGPHALAVFLSYASEDIETAKKLTKGLQDARIPVWFDKSDIKPGDDWQAQIDKGLKNCSLFTPLISKHTLTSASRDFRNEWEAAFRVAPMFRPSRPFIVPIAIDDTSEKDLSDYPLLMKRQWERLQNGQIDGIVNHIKVLFRRVKGSE